MNVCACGETMMVGEPWCKKCWAVWSSWYMRAGGRWFEWKDEGPLEVKAGEILIVRGDGRICGVWRQAAHYPCDCESCSMQLAIQQHVDELEYRVIRTTWRS